MVCSRLSDAVDLVRFCIRPSVALFSTLVLLVASPKDGFAQDSHWGVSVSASPQWTITQRFRDLLSDEDETVNIEGGEFAIGLVRGSSLGGDVSFNYVRKPWKDGLGFASDGTDCFNPGPNQPQICLRDREQNLFEQVMLNGFEVNWFYAPRFGRIKNRVQIGLNVGGGIGKFKGTIHKVEDRQEPVFTPGPPPTRDNPNPGGGTTRIVNVHEEERNPVEDELLSVFPMAKIELMGAVIGTPAVKIKVAGGLNFPGTGFRVLGVYLFGAR
jgi:hypothetical protein